MSKRKFDATIVFMCVPGEEQGLLGATHYAEEAIKPKMNIEAMFTNDIVGGVTSQKNSPNRNRVRVFSEGVPTNETEAEANQRRSVGGENDSVARQLARFIKEKRQLYLFEKNLVLLNDVLQSTPLAGRLWVLGGVLIGWAREGRVLAHDSHDADFVAK